MIGRYWDGDTTPEEEQTIYNFFSSHTSLPEELEQWREWFNGKQALHRMDPDEDFDEKILAYIEPTRDKGRIGNKSLWWLSAAAAVLAIPLSFSWTKAVQTPLPAHEISVAAISEEYETVKGLLYFTSARINQAESELGKNLSKIEVMNEYINIK